MLSTGEGTRDYFDRVPLKWDALYSRDNRLSYAFSRLFRRAIFERFELTFAHCGDVSGATVLDIGCGTGQYAVQFALKGADRVVGIDFSQSMIDFSRDMARRKGVSGHCEFRCADFADVSLEERFDIVVAVGFFDYIEDAGTVFKKIGALTRRRFLASFPRSSPFWRVQRAIRYGWFKGCRVSDYAPQELEDLCGQATFETWRILPLTRGLFLVAEHDEEPERPTREGADQRQMAEHSQTNGRAPRF